MASRDDSSLRLSPRDVPDRLIHEDLVVDLGRKWVWLARERIELTRLEFDLLVALMSEPDRVHTSADLMESVWGYSWLGDAHVVETNIARLRVKLGETAKESRFIHTVRGEGYRFAGILPDAPTVHHLVYDRSLVLLSVQPSNQPILGWQPEEIIGRCHMFSRAEGARSDRDRAIAWVLSASRLRSTLGPISLDVVDRWNRDCAVSVSFTFAICQSGRLHGLAVELVDEAGSSANPMRSPRLGSRDEVAPDRR